MIIVGFEDYCHWKQYCTLHMSKNVGLLLHTSFKIWLISQLICMTLTNWVRSPQFSRDYSTYLHNRAINQEIQYWSTALIFSSDHKEVKLYSIQHLIIPFYTRLNILSTYFIFIMFIPTLFTEVPYLKITEQQFKLIIKLNCCVFYGLWKDHWLNQLPFRRFLPSNLFSP